VNSVRERLLQAGPDEPQLLLDRLRALGTKQYVHGAIFIQRAAEPVLDSPLRLRMLERTTPLDFDRVFRWRRFSRSDGFRDWIAKARPRPAPKLQLSIQHVVENDEIVPSNYVFNVESAFQGQLYLDMTIAPAVLRFNGKRTVADVFEICRAEGMFPSGSTLMAFSSLIRLMVERGFMELDFPG